MMKKRRPKMRTKKHRLKAMRMRRRPKITRRRRPRPPNATRSITLTKPLRMRRLLEMNERPRLLKQMKAQVRRQRATSAKNITRTNIMVKLLLDSSPLSLSGRMAEGGVEGES
jgi:hypothetical protein